MHKDKIFVIYLSLGLIYIPFVKRFPARVHVISALNLLDQAGIPFIKEVVTELAARLWHSRRPL
jgi:hypothetical protein